MQLRQKYWLFPLLFLFILACNPKPAGMSEAEKLDNFFAKESVKIVVTDSGLGGVSVAADVVERIKTAGVFKNVDVIFFNAQPHINSGYNSMKTNEEKVAVFNNALEAMDKNLHPDLILIACNTLSVLYDLTNYAKVATIPVVGIIETGVDLINSRMEKSKKSKVIVFATKTTVEKGKHKAGLMEIGYPEDRIVTEACLNLAGNIERGPESDTTKALVYKYVDEILPQVNEGDELFVSYNCTHYGYVDKVFQQAFKDKGIEVKEFLDPNPLMANFIFDEKYRNRYDSTEVSVKIISQPELSPGRQAAIYELIAPTSQQTADALFEYTFTPDFFEWESVAK
ncbi:MAG: aspartate/glutamate racemase family protein [Deferribacteres bacterium]|nr:aspartate/glutamate racemase family protein [candidate division KSB1 bacterium]MCB9504276.1 aspartate/glutamate racemase family protein [Deferribacteres bacterium]